MNKYKKMCSSLPSHRSGTELVKYWPCFILVDVEMKMTHAMLMVRMEAFGIRRANVASKARFQNPLVWLQCLSIPEALVCIRALVDPEVEEALKT